MMKPISRIVATIALVTVASVIAAQEIEEASVVKVMALMARQDFQKAIAKADADYFKRLAPTEKRLELTRCRSIITTCKKTIAALERIADNAKRGGSDVEAAIAKGKIEIVKEYLAKAEADMPEETISKPASRVRSINTLGARIKYGKSSYLAILRRVTWDQARRMAESQGGRLASIGSVQELMFLRKLVNREAWVGGLPGGDPVQWRWLDGENIPETLWPKAPPKAEPDHRVRISIKDGMVASRATNIHDAFIIEWSR